MTLVEWWRLLSRNRFRVHPLRWGLVFTVTCVALFNTVMGWLQRAVYGRRLADADRDAEILFIIGHWRSGTTLLHELVVLDPRYSYPTTFECFSPNHFLLTGKWLPKLIWFLLPAKRPMDDMALSFDHPQEDEFALISMGAPSPLLRIAFPNHPPPDLEFLDMTGVRDEDLGRWKDRMRKFVAMQVVAKQRPLVLKSPTHTGRVEVLAEMFPRAKFLHITRDPYQLFSSTQRLWRALDVAQGFQLPRETDLDEFVFTALERMYGGLQRQRAGLAPSRICDVKYEDLIADPVATLRRAYECLAIEGFEEIAPQIAESMQRRKNHQTNRHSLPDELRREIRRRWNLYFESYGYGTEAGTG